MQTLLIITNLPDRDSAEKLARTLVHRHHAACVNLLPAVSSVYRWQGEIETAEEIPLWIKTPEDRYFEVEATIREFHPYQTPEIISLPVGRGLPDYLNRVLAETRHP
jgi:periplasmic divalent cation tolerance protein